MKKPVKDMSLMHDESDNIVMFYPHVSKLAKKAVMEVLDTRWIGQGPKVKLFEESFSNKFASKLPAIAVGSGTDALHLSYILAGLKPGDEVIAPVFTCTATNIPFLYMGVKINFADIDPETMNIDVSHVRQLMNQNVKAIVCVHYGGLPCDMDELQFIADEWGVPIIEDAAHAVGAKYKGRDIGSISDYTIFSFKAIPVKDVLVLIKSSGKPSKTKLPPLSPPPGPKSIIQSADLIISKLCSIIITVLPLFTNVLSTSINTRISSK